MRLLGKVEEALKDLETAIKLSDGKDTLTLRQAYTQRGYIRRLQGDEDGAFVDFDVAAKLGGEQAKKEAQKLNPYAKLCNEMLTKKLLSKSKRLK